MLGSAVNYNFLKICIKKTLYNFNISAKKNGDYEKILYWLKMSLPIKVHKRISIVQLSRHLLNSPFYYDDLYKLLF